MRSLVFVVSGWRKQEETRVSSSRRRGSASTYTLCGSMTRRQKQAGVQIIRDLECSRTMEGFPFFLCVSRGLTVVLSRTQTNKMFCGLTGSASTARIGSCLVFVIAGTNYYGRFTRFSNGRNGNENGSSGNGSSNSEKNSDKCNTKIRNNRERDGQILSLFLSLSASCLPSLSLPLCCWQQAASDHTTLHYTTLQ